MLEGLISREDCANCRSCCQFEPDELIDAPVFNQEQVEYIHNNIDEKIEFQKNGKAYQIKLIPFGKKYKCPLLSDHGCVLPNEYRPFDCESWPYYVMKKEDTYVITKSKDCPIFNQLKDEVLIDFIQKKFLKIAIDIIHTNPEVVTEYNRDLPILYEISEEELEGK